MNSCSLLHSPAVGKGTVGLVNGEVPLTRGDDNVLEGIAIVDAIWAEGVLTTEPKIIKRAGKKSACVPNMLLQLVLFGFAINR